MPTDTLPPTPPTTPLQLATLSPTGKPPAYRLTSANDAKQLAEYLFWANRTRLERCRPIQGMFDGNPPYDQNRLRKRNEGWRANFNTLEAESRADAAKTPYYDLGNIELLADCATRVDGPRVSATDASRIRSEEFTKLCRAWSGYNAQTWVMLDDFIKWGRGFLWWPREDSWHFERLAWNRVYFPNGHPTDPEKWDTFVVRHEWTVTQLYRMVKDEQAARAAGWNAPMCWRAIRQAVPPNIVSIDVDPISFQQHIRDRDTYISAASPVVQAASVFTREFDNKWSRMVVVVNEDGREKVSSSTPQSAVEQATQRGQQDNERQSARLGDKDWLYNRHSVAESIYELLVPFIYEVSDGSINGIKGLGQRIVSLMQAKMRSENAMLDSAMIRSSIVLQAQGGGAMSKLAQMQIGALSVLPPGFAVQAGTIFGDLEGSLAVQERMSNNLDTNTGTYRPQIEKPRGNPESATLSQLRYTNASVLSNSAVNRYQDQRDVFFYQLYKRASSTLPDVNEPGIRSARRFQQRLRERGLSDAQIRDCEPGLVVAMRSLGNGSMTMKQQVTGALLPLTQTDMVGPRGRHNIAREYTAAWGGQHAVEMAFPPEDEQQVPTRDEWDASQENSDMAQGSPVLFATWQDHALHAASHLQAGFAAIQAVQQGADPTGASTFLTIALPHIEQHAMSIRDERKQKQVVQMLRELQQEGKVVEQAVEQQAAQREQASTMTFDQELAAREAQHKMQMAEAKVQHGQQLKAARQQSETEMAQQRAAQEAALADATTAAAITRETAATAAKLENDRKVADAKAAAVRAKPASGGSNE